MEQHKRYKIVICPKCQRMQTIESSTVLKCKLCGKTTKMVNKKLNEWSIKIYGSFDNPHEASAVCTRLKGKTESGGSLKYKGDEKWMNEF